MSTEQFTAQPQPSSTAVLESKSLNFGPQHGVEDAPPLIPSRIEFNLPDHLEDDPIAFNSKLREFMQKKLDKYNERINIFKNKETNASNPELQDALRDLRLAKNIPEGKNIPLRYIDDEYRQQYKDSYISQRERTRIEKTMANRDALERLKYPKQGYEGYSLKNRLAQEEADRTILRGILDGERLSLGKKLKNELLPQELDKARKDSNASPAHARAEAELAVKNRIHDHPDIKQKTALRRTMDVYFRPAVQLRLLTRTIAADPELAEEVTEAIIPVLPEGRVITRQIDTLDKSAYVVAQEELATVLAKIEESNIQEKGAAAVQAVEELLNTQANQISEAYSETSDNPYEKLIEQYGVGSQESDEGVHDTPSGVEEKPARMEDVVYHAPVIPPQTESGSFTRVGFQEDSLSTLVPSKTYSQFPDLDVVKGNTQKPTPVHKSIPQQPQSLVPKGDSQDVKDPPFVKKRNGDGNMSRRSFLRRSRKVAGTLAVAAAVPTFAIEEPGLFKGLWDRFFGWKERNVSTEASIFNNNPGQDDEDIARQNATLEKENQAARLKQEEQRQLQEAADFREANLKRARAGFQLFLSAFDAGNGQLNETTIDPKPAWIYPFSGCMHMLETMCLLPDPGVYKQDLARRFTALDIYRADHGYNFRHPDIPNSSLYSPNPVPDGTATDGIFLDDNVNVINNLLRAYTVLKNLQMLTIVQNNYATILKYRGALNGITWMDLDTINEESIKTEYEPTNTNASIIQASINLYKQTREVKYLNDAETEYYWLMNNGLVDPKTSLIYDGIKPNRQIGRQEWSCNEGDMIVAYAKLLDVTHNDKYSRNLQRSVQSALDKFDYEKLVTTQSLRYVSIYYRSLLYASQFVSQDLKQKIIDKFSNFLTRMNDDNRIINRSGNTVRFLSPVDKVPGGGMEITTVNAVTELYTLGALTEDKYIRLA